MPTKKIFLTGVTGFLGGAVAAELLEQGAGEDLLVLVRADTIVEAQDRIARSLARFGVSPRRIRQISVDQILLGGLRDLPPIQEDSRLGKVTHVLNCAAVTSFGRNAQTWPTNHRDTLGFLRRVLECPRIERVAHVSTAMICGTNPPPIIYEDDFPSENTRHLIDYSASKAATELELKQTLPDAPLTVIRPSIIVGHSRLGCKPSHSIFWTLRIADILGMIMWPPETQIDIVPVDYAAKAVVHLLFQQRLRHRAYHVSSGPAASVTFHDISRAFSAWKGHDHADSYRHVSYAEIARRKDAFPELFGPCNKRYMLQAIRLYGAFAGLNTTFDNTRLLKSGFDAPLRFDRYLPLCADSVKHLAVPQQMVIDLV